MIDSSASTDLSTQQRRLQPVDDGAGVLPPAITPPAPPSPGTATTQPVGPSTVASSPGAVAPPAAPPTAAPTAPLTTGAPIAPPTTGPIDASGSPTSVPSSTPPAITPPPASIAAPASGLPAGFTLGDPGGANWGNAYYNGQQVSGLGAGGIELADGSFVPNSTADQFQQLETAENANYQTPQAVAARIQQSGETSTDPAMKAVLTNPEYQQLVAQAPGGQVDFQQLWSQASPELQALIRQSPMYGFGTGSGADLLQKHLAATAGNGGAAIPQSDIDRVMGLAQNGLPMKPPTPAGQQAAPTGGPNVSTFNPMTLAAPGASPQPPMITPGSPMSLAPAGSTQTGSTGLGGASSGIPGVATAQINPSADLRSQMILPGNDPRLSNLSSMVDQAANGVSNVDRVKLAQDMFKTFQSSTQPDYDLALRQATQKAAANGQLGSGMLNTSYGDLAHQREQELDNEKNSLIQNATEGSIQDALNKEGVLQGLEGQVYGEGAANRGELRTERTDEQNQNQQAINNALQQYLAALFGQNQQFNQGLEELNAGSAGNPANTYLQGAAAYGGMDPATLLAIARGLGSNSVPTATTGG